MERETRERKQWRVRTGENGGKKDGRDREERICESSTGYEKDRERETEQITGGNAKQNWAGEERLRKRWKIDLDGRSRG